jgi:periplasmic divalent cation tolerance protein
MAAEPLLVLCTCPGNTVAAEIATALIEQNLAACVNRLTGVKSWYRWQGHLHEDDEVLLLIKTTRPRMAEVQATIGKLHPSELPELIAVPITAGSEAYLTWISDSTRG